MPIIALETERVLNPEETKAYNAGMAASGLRMATTAPAQASGGTLVFAEPAWPGEHGPLATVRCGGFTVDTWRAQDPAGLHVLGSATRATR